MSGNKPLSSCIKSSNNNGVYERSVGRRNGQSFRTRVPTGRQSKDGGPKRRRARSCAERRGKQGANAQLETRFTELSNELEQSNQKYQAAIEKAQQTENNLEEANERVVNAATQLQQARERADSADEIAQQANARANAADERTEQANAQAEQANAQAEQAKEDAKQAEIRAATAEENAREALAQGLELEVQLEHKVEELDSAKEGG